MTKQPRVSIIVPTRNSAATLPACLQSIQDQSYKNIELIVVDNYSTDETSAIAKRFTKHVYTKGPERSPQRNYGVGKASGAYVLIIDSDMELSGQVVAQCVAAVQADSAVTGVVIHEESFGVGYWAKAKALERSFYINVPWIEGARFFPTAIYAQLRGYDETLISGEDWDLSKRAQIAGKLTAIEALIHHNEGHVKLSQTLRKKYYYAQHARAYLAANPEKNMLTAQSGPLNRYKLFFSQPGKLFRKPLLGISMLSMKTAEFGAGATGYITSYRKT